MGRWLWIPDRAQARVRNDGKGRRQRNALQAADRRSRPAQRPHLGEAQARGCRGRRNRRSAGAGAATPAAPAADRSGRMSPPRCGVTQPTSATSVGLDAQQDELAPSAAVVSNGMLRQTQEARRVARGREAFDEGCLDLIEVGLARAGGGSCAAPRRDAASAIAPRHAAGAHGCGRDRPGSRADDRGCAGAVVVMVIVVVSACMARLNS